ncbi:MAG: LysR family transcriptional regulator [Pseudomonas sp.]|nr:LysR family transcriptional regulator [Pseudomonas sp.]
MLCLRLTGENERSSTHLGVQGTSALNQLQAIRCFARVVETLSFTKAADSLDIPKATVSKMVQDLETHLGIQLLHRSTRKVTVTADGFAYYEGTARLIRDLEDFDLGFAGSHVLPSGKIRVDVGGTPGRMIIVPALPDFFARYPDMQIDLGVGDHAVDLIGDNVDCVIRGGPQSRLSPVSRMLGMASWVTCATPAYLEQYGTPMHPNDLRHGHRIIGYQQADTGRALPSRFERGTETIEIEGPYSISVNDGGARAIAGLRGLGVLQTFRFAIKEHLDSGALIPILEQWRPAPYPFRIVYPANRKLSRRVRVFIDWLVEVFETLE